MRAGVMALALLASALPPSAGQAQTPPAQASAAVAPVPVRTLSPQEAAGDVALMRRALETIHPGLYRRTSRRAMDRAFDALERSVAAGPVTDVELYRRVSAVLALVRCTHTKADQPDALESWRQDNPSHLPFRFALAEGRMIVLSSDPGQPPLPRGAEIVSINGRPVARLIATLGAYVPVDGFTEGSRAAYLASDGDLMGADFDHFYPYVFGFPQRFTLVLRDGPGAPRRTLTLVPVPFRTWRTFDSAGRPYRQDFADAVSWRMLDGQTGYLAVATFVNYRRPVDAAALYARALDELRAAGAQSLVLDLRANGGGSNDAALALIDALATGPYVYQRAIRYRAVRYGDLPDHISSWGDRDALFAPPLDRFVPAADGWFDLRADLAPEVLMPRAPAPGAFTGPVTVLAGPANASGATMVVARLRAMGRVRVVGARTGGSADGPTAGTIFAVRLPASGIVVRVPLVFNQMAVDRFDPRGGVQPDVPVPVTVADLRAGRDRALAAAMADLHRPH